MIPTPELARLTEIPLRDVWKHEAHNFTQWLALDENMSLLSEAIDIELLNAQTEVAAGLFRIDILAQDLDDNLVVIENQLENSNHDHLGKIITYAAMHKATVIVWIVADVRDEHEQAINWLNEHTDEDINIFLIQIKAVRIGESKPAPIFDIIARPNRRMKSERRNATMSPETQLFKQNQAIFWEYFIQRLQNEKNDLITGHAPPRQQIWINIRFGLGKARISLTILQKPTPSLEVQLYIPNDKELFNHLLEMRDTIEAKIGSELEWMYLPERSASKIKIVREGDYTEALKEGNEKYLDELIAWLIKYVNVFAETFEPIVKNY